MNIRKIISASLLVLGALVASAQVEVEIIDGLNDVLLKSTIEKNASRFMSETYNAYNQNRALNLTSLVAPSAEISIEMLWENVHFRPEDQYIGEILLNSNGGYQMRNIPIAIQPQDSNSDENYKEAVLNFDKNGRLTDVYFSIEENTYRQIMDKGIQLNDVERRLQILDYVERFRTAYNQKDLTFLNQVFSEDALIITGKVIRPNKNPGDGLSLSLPQVKYTKQSKQQYLSNLARAFKNAKYINVNFADVQIKRHGINPNIYGVRVVQEWNASNYSDEGYVFMVWDFTNPDTPQIHVRAWQPKWLDEKNKVPLPEDEIFNINSIEGI